MGSCLRKVVQKVLEEGIRMAVRVPVAIRVMLVTVGIPDLPIGSVQTLPSHDAVNPRPAHSGLSFALDADVWDRVRGH